MGEIEFVQKFEANSSTDGGFGEVVAINDNIAAISAAYGIVPVVYIYKYDKITDEWDRTQTLNMGSGRGDSLALSKNFLVIGDGQSREAHVYKLNDTSNSTFYQVATLDNGVGGGSFGWNCDITYDDNYIIMGDVDSNEAYIFSRNGDNWYLNDTLTEGSETQFGESVSIGIGYAAASAWRTGTGTAYVYKYNKNTGKWDDLQVFEGESNNDEMGRVMDFYIAGDNNEYYNNNYNYNNKNISLLAISLSADSVNEVNIYLLNSTGSGYFNLIQVLDSSNSHTSEFGYDITMFDNKLAIGARASYNTRGEIYIYELENINDFDNVFFDLFKNITAYDANNGDMFSTQISMYNEWLIVGTIDGEEAYIYDVNLSTGSKKKKKWQMF